MSRLLVGVVLAALFFVGAAGGREDKDKPKDRPAVPGEKTDAKVDRSLSGVVEKVEVKFENFGAVVLRTSGPPTHYTFEVNKQTKILGPTGDPLEAGLKSPLLKGAPVRVTFVDQERKGDQAGQPDRHICRTLQLMKPAK